MHTTQIKDVSEALGVVAKWSKVLVPWPLTV